MRSSRTSAFIVLIGLVAVFQSQASAELAAAASTAKTASAMTDAAKQIIASLEPDQAKKATFAFDDPKRVDWHNIPKPNRKGLPVREMSDEQKKLCHALLKIALSDSGYAKAQKIFMLENNVRAGEGGVAPLRDSGLYFLSVFGTPDEKGTWGWSFEGHHLSLNFVIRDGKVVADTPSFWGANPATVHVFVKDGPEVGTRTLGDEEQPAFDLMESLDDSQKARAIVAEKAPADYRAAGKPQPAPESPKGILGKDLNDAQKRLLHQVLESYSSHLTKELADAQMAEVDAAGLDAVHFAWLGGTKPGTQHDFRVEGPTFMLELVNYQSDLDGNPANHIHSVWRDPRGDFAVPVKSATTEAK